MTELELLDSNIDGLKKLLAAAWSDLANPSLPQFEHRQRRSQVRQYSVELRSFLQLKEAERCRVRNRLLAGHDLGRPDFGIPA